MSLKDLWRLDWMAGSRQVKAVVVVVLVVVVKEVRKRGTVALTLTLIFLSGSWEVRVARFFAAEAGCGERVCFFRSFY